MNTIDQLESGILEEATNQSIIQKTEKSEAAIFSRRIARSIIENHKDDGKTPELDNLISEGVDAWASYSGAEPKQNAIAELAKKNRIIK